MELVAVSSLIFAFRMQSSNRFTFFVHQLILMLDSKDSLPSMMSLTIQVPSHSGIPLLFLFLTFVLGTVI